MAVTYTTNLDLQKPGIADRGWNVQLDANVDTLDALAPIGHLAVTPREVPSTSLYLSVAAGEFRKADGTAGIFGGSVTHQVINGTRYVYLDGSGNLTSAAAWPATSHVRLAIVTASGGVISSIQDARITCSVVGTDSLAYLPTGGGAMAEGGNIAAGTSTGTKIGTATSQKLGFFGATPIVRPAAYTQTYSTADRTLGSYSPDAEGSAYTGIASGVGGSPYAQLSDLNNLRAAYENLRTLTEDLAQLVNALVDDLQALGLIG